MMDALERQCPVCRYKKHVKGRAVDGRRCYSCSSCLYEWTEGMQCRKQKFNDQRKHNQFRIK